MRQKRARVDIIIGVLLFSTLAFLAGCATKQDVLKAKLRGHGSERRYAVSVDQAWNIAKTVLQLEPTDAIDEHRSEGYMLTSQDAGPLSSGTYLGVFFDPQDDHVTKVTFVARRKSATQSYPFLNEATFHHKFEQLVSLMAQLGSTCGVTDPASSAVDAGGGSRGGDAGRVDSSD